MAKIGVEGPWVAKYTAVGGVASYTEGIKLARMTEFSSEIESSEDNNFYSDNGISESDRSFSGGSFSDTVDHFSQEGSKYILGYKEEKVIINGKEFTELIGDDDANAPYLGHGVIFTKIKSGKRLYRAVVFTKTMYSIPSEAATTQGESVEWQAEEISGTILRDDSPTNRWKREATFNMKEDAISYIEQILNIRSIGILILTSVPGTEIGDTIISVTPNLSIDNKYLYLIATEVGMPSFEEIISDGFTSWDGVREITATSGNQLLIVEVNDENKAIKAGIIEVSSRELE